MEKQRLIINDLGDLSNSILPILEEINKSKMCKEIGIPKSSFYYSFYNDNKFLENLQKTLDYCGYQISIKLTKK